MVVISPSPASLGTSLNDGRAMRSTPEGAMNPLAIAIALTAWFRAPAPIVWSSQAPFSRITPAMAPATALGLDLVETRKTSMPVPCSACGWAPISVLPVVDSSPWPILYKEALKQTNLAFSILPPDPNNVKYYCLCQ